ncbi:MAG: GNAT family N-acetyltransferase [Candidatus Bathyarchaeota archaeon]|nr:GNAT family N-acetyltransferase [Candidatus Bathyarchaeota archaeon]
MAEEYRFHRPETEEDYEQLYDVMRRSFTNEDVDVIVRRLVEHHPEMTETDYFMVKQGDEAVAGLILIPQKWNIDDVEMKVAEMGCVGTVPEHRRHGVQWILNNHFDEYAKSRDYDMCVLAGIPYFYRQFGYQYAVELDYETKIDLNKLPTETSLVSREFKDSDIPEAQRLLEHIQSNYLVHSIRTPEMWKMQQETGTYGAEPFKGTAILDNEKLVAYYRWWAEEEVFNIKELALKSDAYIEEVAACIRREAEEKGAKRIKTKLSDEDAFSKYLIGLGAETIKPYGWQIKLLDPRSFIEKLGPVLEKRLAESEFKGLTKELRMNFWKYKIKLDFKDGKLVSVEHVSEAKRVLGMNPYASIQLFLGFRSREDLDYAYPDFYIRGGNEGLIDVLFPRKPGYIHYCY